MGTRKKMLAQRKTVQTESKNQTRETKILHYYYIQNPDDYKKYNRLCGMITGLVKVIKKIDLKDPYRDEITTKLLAKLLEIGIISAKKSLTQIEKLSATSFCRRRLAVILVRLKMARTVLEANTFVKHRHIQIGPDIVTDPAIHVTKYMENFIKWSDTSEIKNKIKHLKNELDDFEMLHC